MEYFVFEQHVLFRIDFCSVTSYRWVECPRVGLEVNLVYQGEEFDKLLLSF